MEHARDLLIGLVALAGHDHYVTTPGGRNGGLDRACPIGVRVHLRTRTRDARGDLPDDRLRILAAGIVARDPHHVGVLRGDAAHLRALPAVPVAPAPEDAHDPAVRRLANRREERTQRVRRVRVVHDDVEGGVRADRLHAPRDRLRVPERLRGGSGVDAQEHAGLQREARVLHGEPSADGDRHVPAGPRVGHPGRPDHDPVQVPGGRLHRRDVREGRELPTGRIVHVDHGVPCTARTEQGELRLTVGLHRPVEVDVVARQVREHRHVEHGPRHTVQREGVRGDLHHHVGRAVGRRIRDARLELERLGRRPRTGQRAEDERPPSGGPEDGRDERHRGRLPVGPGHPDHGHAGRRPVQEIRHDRADDGPDVRHPDHSGSARCNNVAVHDECDGACGRHVTDDRVRVERGTPHAEDEVTGPDLTGVVADPRHRHLDRLCGTDYRGHAARAHR